MENKILPLGTVVFLEEGTKKVMVIGRGIIYKDQETDADVYTDYMGCLYPMGIDPKQTIFFNRENIDKVIFIGLCDEEEERYAQVYGDWEKNLQVPKKKI